jgi:membrane protease YdiL (CAAX protease family)
VSPVARWRWWVHLILIGGYFIPSLFFYPARIGPELTNSAAGLLVVSAIDILFFALVFAVAVRISRATRDDLYLRWRPGWSVVPLGVGYSVAIRLVTAVVAIIVVALVAVAGVQPEDLRHFMDENRPQLERIANPEVMRSSPAYYWLSITLISFLNAGIREEFWRTGTLAGLRALFPGTFRSVGGQIVAAGGIAILFGAAHARLGFIAAVVAGALGFMLGIIIIFHRSVWPAVFAHGFFDAATFAALPFIIRHLNGS